MGVESTVEPRRIPTYMVCTIGMGIGGSGPSSSSSPPSSVRIGDGFDGLLLATICQSPILMHRMLWSDRGSHPVFSVIWSIMTPIAS
jgi:hypothetical protein